MYTMDKTEDNKIQRVIRFLIYTFNTVFFNKKQFCLGSMFISTYRQFLKTLPRSSAFLNKTSVMLYETDCSENSSRVTFLFKEHMLQCVV